MLHADVIVVGGGSAGSTAAIKAQQALPRSKTATLRPAPTSRDRLAGTPSTPLEDGEAGVRREAVIALGYLRHGEAVEGLRGRLADPDPAVRRVAVGSLSSPLRGRRCWKVFFRRSANGDEGPTALAAPRRQPPM